MLVIGIGGARSGAGKTHLACNIIRSLGSRASAIKVTPDDIYTSIIDDPDILSEKGKDTALMLEAGAAKVLWVRSPREGMSEALETAMDMLGQAEVVIVEGNSAIEVLRPGIVLFIDRLSGSEGSMKPGSNRVLEMADVVVHGGTEVSGAPEDARQFSLDETEAYTEYVLSLCQEMES